MKKIKFNTITFTNENEYDSENYPNSGFYRVNQNNLISIFLVQKSNIPFTLFLGYEHEVEKLIQEFIEMNQEEIEVKPEVKQNSEGMISESFALKMIALSMNKEKLKDINL